MGRSVVLVALMVAFIGCATPSFSGTIQIGQYATGRFMANANFLAPETLATFCENAEAWACTREWYNPETKLYELNHYARNDLGVEYRKLYGMVHEQCHAVANLQHALDPAWPGPPEDWDWPCHNESASLKDRP